MDFDSPDVEKDFPGLYESGSSRKKNEEDCLGKSEEEAMQKHTNHAKPRKGLPSDAEHEKISKKELLLGRRKDKKDKKDLRYATLDGESSSPEDDHDDMKSPSKSAKKSKAFKFATSKSKEKREKSRDKEKMVDVKDTVDSSGKLDKKKDKEKKEKEKKEKNKDKDKKDKKSKQSSINEEILELGDAQPIFGVSLGLAVERSRCHDNINLPHVVRDCIDYLQEYGLQNDQIYKMDASKARMQQLKKLYNNRDSLDEHDFDVPTACSLLKLYLRELPEPILTTDLCTKFEEIAALPQSLQQENELHELIAVLPNCNRTLLSWLLLHFTAVIDNEKSNKMSAQTLAMLLSPTLQMSHRLLVVVLAHATNLFDGDTILFKYVPPITSASPNLPETSEEIIIELRKQDSLLNQIHAEMNTGYVSKKREEQLWEVQRIITQLKRKLRSFEKKQDQTHKSLDDTIDPELSIELNPRKTKSSLSDDESFVTMTMVSESTTNTGTKTTPQATPENSSTMEDKLKEVHHLTVGLVNSGGGGGETLADEQQQLNSNPNNIYIHESGLMMLSETHPEFPNLLRLQLENIELAQWKLQLQARINSERADIVRIKDALRQSNLIKQQQQHHRDSLPNNNVNAAGDGFEDIDYARIIAQYLKENALLEQKRNLLACEIFDENKELIQLQVDLAMKKFKV